MTSDKRTMLKQIFSRLCFHVGTTPEHHAQKCERFIASLLSYPEDLICAAYHYVLKHTPYAHLPSEEEFIQFMTPEFKRREDVKCTEGV